MSLNITQKSQGKVEQPKTLPEPKTSSTMITENGKSFLVTTKNLTCLERLSKGVQAFFLTAITLFVALFFQCVRDKWKAAFTGKEIIEKKEQSAASTNTITDKTSKTFSKTQPTITHQTSKEDEKTTSASLSTSVSKQETKDSDQTQSEASSAQNKEPLLSQKVDKKKKKMDMSVFDKPLEADKIDGLKVYDAFDEFPKASDEDRLKARDETLQLVKTNLPKKKEAEKRRDELIRRMEEKRNEELKKLEEEKKKGKKVKPHVQPAPAQPFRLTLSEHPVTSLPVLFLSSEEGFHGEELLGRFDVLECSCKMDYDDVWHQLREKSNKRQKFFLVHHAAGINIGEKENADDFKDYATKDGKLDEDKYVADMGRIYGNILKAQSRGTAAHAVWFPLGMGAFLKNLHLNDAAYLNPEKKFALRKRLAEEFVKQLGDEEFLQIHLCLAYEKGKGSETELNQNYNAFILALANASKSIKERVQLHINVDAPYLAQRMANIKGELSVSLVNAANRKLIGNKWNEDGAKQAIDENLHRRSSHLALLSYELNGECFDYKKREKGELVERIKKAGIINTI